jgi:hypothetical protein
MGIIAGDKGGHMSPHFEKWGRQNYVFDPTLFGKNFEKAEFLARKQKIWLVYQKI